VFTLVFTLVAFATTMNVVDIGRYPHAIDVALLLTTLFLGVAHLWWSVSLAFATRPSTATSTQIVG